MPPMSDDEPQVGRPSAFKPEYVEQAKRLCLLGATDQEIAEFFGVSRTTITNWKNEYPEFLAALKTAKAEADERVERSLYHRAVGYTFDSEEIRVLRDGTVVRVPTKEHVPPDTTAMIFWLKNRRKDVWRDVQQHEHGKPGDFEKMNADELRGYIASEAEALGLGGLAVAPRRGKGKTNGAGRPH